MDHRKHFSLLFLILTHPRFVLSSFGNGKLMVLDDTGCSYGIEFHQPWNIKQNFIKKNVNLDDKKSLHSVKKTQKFIVKWQKVTN